MADVELRIPLPEDLDAHVKERVVQGRYNAAADYVIALIREDKERRLHEDLDRRLLEGLASEGEEVTPEYLAELRREVQERIDKQRQRA